MANPSLAMIPSGYKATKLYSVLPADGVGDFDVTRASTATRVNSSGLIEEVGVNVPRLDYSDGGCPVLLTEPQSTNLAKWSEDFSNGVWIKNRSSFTLNSIISPDGNLIMGYLTEDATASNTHYIRRLETITDGIEYTFSVFAKAKERTIISLGDNAAAQINTGVWFDLYNGVILTQKAGYIGKIENYGNGIYRCSVTYTGKAARQYFDIAMSESDGVNVYTGDGTSGIYIWGAQLEQQSYPTSYIKTEGTTVTRNADVVEGAGDVTTFNSEEGVLFVEMASLNPTGQFAELQIDDGTNDNRVQIYYNFLLNQVVFKVGVGTVQEYSHTETVTDVYVQNKYALKWANNNFSSYVNGVEVDSSNSGDSFPISTLNNLKFQSNFKGKTKDIRVYKTALTDSELEELTSWESFILMANGLNYTIK